MQVDKRSENSSSKEKVVLLPLPLRLAPLLLYLSEGSDPKKGSGGGVQGSQISPNEILLAQLNAAWP
jgi:hypothetical protein